MTMTGDPLAAFIEAACVPLDRGHGSETLEHAEAILAAHSEVASSDIHTVAILGDDAAVRRFLALDARSATAKGGPRGWDALTHPCFSRYRRLDRATWPRRATRVTMPAAMPLSTNCLHASWDLSKAIGIKAGLSCIFDDDR
ncbi:MAG: hypothetical protein L0387_18125 [Acidobacteria bacterium]|nr:hypothetical protein [Acidobacteriota bacterium]MCI0719113.1 hypothetical protein [Acidobacteriota bacterium]